MAGISVNDLSEIFLFQLMKPQELKELIESNVLFETFYGPGTKIFSQNERGETMYVILSGAVRITRNDFGKEIEIASLTSGDFFGEITLFEYALRTGDAFIAEESRLVGINRNDFNQLFLKKPHLAAKILFQMMTEMSRRLRKKNDSGGGLIF